MDDVDGMDILLIEFLDSFFHCVHILYDIYKRLGVGIFFVLGNAR